MANIICEDMLITYHNGYICTCVTVISKSLLEPVPVLWACQVLTHWLIDSLKFIHLLCWQTSPHQTSEKNKNDNVQLYVVNKQPPFNRTQMHSVGMDCYTASSKITWTLQPGTERDNIYSCCAMGWCMITRRERQGPVPGSWINTNILFRPFPFKK